MTLPLDTSLTTSGFMGRPCAPVDDDRDVTSGAEVESDDTVNSGAAAARYQIREGLEEDEPEPL